jgi:hypothetical protein
MRALKRAQLPPHRSDVVITARGRLCLHRKGINISTALAGQKLGIKEVDEGILARKLHATQISDTSTWSRKPCNPSTTNSAQGWSPMS